MAKRYHQSKKDRMDERSAMHRHYGTYRQNAHDRADERRGVEHRRDKFNDEFHHDREGNGGLGFREIHEPYAGMGMRRRMEMQDAGMIRDDYSSIANLPQQVMIKSYPKTGPYLPEGLNDTIEGVDRQMDYDDGKRREHFYPKKV